MDDLEQKLNQLHERARLKNSPTQRNGFALGDSVRLPNIDCVFEVIGLSDESLVELRAPSGRTLRAGWRVISKVRMRNSK